MKNLLLSGLLALTFAPFSAFALTVSDLQNQIAALQVRIQELTQGKVLGASTICPNLTRSLSYGSRGTDVTQLQQFLVAQGLLSAGNDSGYFGSGTRAAVQRFQCLHPGLMCGGNEITTGFGVVGPKTRAVIAASCVSLQAPKSATQASSTIPTISPTSTPLIPVTAVPSVTPTTTAPPALSQLPLADLSDKAVQDLLSHFWSGAHAAGHIVATNDGISALSRPKGDLWQAATFFDDIYGIYRLTHSADSLTLIQSEWAYIKTNFTSQELTACGANSSQNWAIDDAGWNATMFLNIYDVLRDDAALADAKGIVSCAYGRWYDSANGGGLWYNDSKNNKSLVQAGITLAAYRIYEITKDPQYLQYAQLSYGWIETHLLRMDGAYWMDYGSSGPVGSDRPSDIWKKGRATPGSVSSIGGTMAMSILHKKFYDLNAHDPNYIARMETNSKSLLNTFTDGGVFINDRDPWADGYFVRQWAEEVLPVISSSLSQQARAVLETTARSIYQNARTNDGYYGGDFYGPAVGQWAQAGFTAQQLMTSANTVDFVVAAAPPHTTTILPPPPLHVSAIYLGQSGEDVVGALTSAPDGFKDVHVKLTGITVPIQSVDISGDSGRWLYPADGSTWIVAIRPQADPTIVDVYFNYYKPSAAYSLSVTFADGRSVTVQAAPPPLSISASLLGQTGEDYVGALTADADGTKDVHIRLAGVQSPIVSVDIGATAGHWAYPADGSTWIVSVRPQTDPTTVDLYFNFYQQFTQYTLSLKLSDGRSVQVAAQ